jgi:ubiquinone/menaquinone biosynthesis C-methylase UbiE
MKDSGIALNERQVFENFKNTFDLNGKRILEVGGAISFKLVNSLPIKEWVAIDPLNDDRSIGAKYRKIQGIAQQISYSENSFDFIFSSNAFHLISRFDEALREFYRVLKNDGYLYTHYGPIWSACDGSQIENVCYQGKEYIFWRDHLIPHWYHLTFDEKELSQILTTKLDIELVNKLVYHIYKGKWVNRMFYEDYITSFLKSNFTIVVLVSCDTLDYDPVFPNYDHPLVERTRNQDILALIQQKYGKDKKNIYCRDMKVILRKIEQKEKQKS